MKRLSRLIAGGAAVGSALAVTGFLLTSEQKRLIKSPGIKIFKYGSLVNTSDMSDQNAFSVFLCGGTTTNK